MFLVWWWWRVELPHRCGDLVTVLGPQVVVQPPLDIYDLREAERRLDQHLPDPVPIPVDDACSAGATAAGKFIKTNNGRKVQGQGGVW